MGGADNGLTLEGLAQRLGALERENARLRDEVAAFRGSDDGADGVGGVLRTRSASQADNGAEDGGGQSTEVPQGRMDRRRLLKGAAAAAASLVVAGSLTQRNIREAKAAAVVYGAATGDDTGVEGTSHHGYGVEGGTGSPDRAAVFGLNSGEVGGPGVQGDSFVGPGVVGNGATLQPENRQYDGANGVVGNGTGVGNGVVGNGGYGGGEAGLIGAGVLGRNILIAPWDAADLGFGFVNHQPLGVGVKGEGTLSGVEGHAMGEGFDAAFPGNAVAAAGGVGVLGRDTNVNRGVGVQGESPNLGVKGTSPRVGVSGEGPSDGSITHIAVRGISPKGLGGVFGGGRAQLLLAPNSAPTGPTGRPTTGTHQAGEVFMNSAADLLICTRSGSPGTWRKFQTVPA